MQPPNPSQQEMIAAICAAFGGDDPASCGDVPKAKVLEWMRSSDLQVQGALYSMVSDAARAGHIRPALQVDDYYTFVLDYLERCIELDDSREWVDSRYLAGHQLVAWIVDFWNNASVPREKLAEIKRRLSALYKRGDDGVRDAVLNAVLEHLFEHQLIANYFQSWESDPILSSAYRDALLWVKKKL
jgi:hypothetical protein